MSKSIFLGPDRKKIVGNQKLVALVLHLHNAERYPLDIDDHLASLGVQSFTLAMGIIESHQKGAPFFGDIAAMLDRKPR